MCIRDSLFASQITVVVIIISGGVIIIVVVVISNFCVVPSSHNVCTFFQWQMLLDILYTLFLLLIVLKKIF